MRKQTAIAAFLTFVGLAILSSSATAQRLVTPLGDAHEPLQSDFNAAGEHPRLVVVLSPT